MIDGGFMEFMGQRNMVVEDKIEECLDRVRNGETEINIERGDLTDGEVDYLEREVKRRAAKEIY